MSRHGRRCHGLHCPGCRRGSRAGVIAAAGLALAAVTGGQVVTAVTVVVLSVVGVVVLGGLVVVVVVVRRYRRRRAWQTPYTAVMTASTAAGLEGDDAPELYGRVVRELPSAEQPAYQSAPPVRHAVPRRPYTGRPARTWRPGDRP